MKKNNIIFLFLVTTVYFLVFHVFFLDINPVFGDAPNFSSNLINTYFGLPQLWRARAENFGGVPIGDIALSGIMMFYSLIHRIFGLASQNLLKIIFYFPATILAFSGGYFFSGLFLRDKVVRLIVSFFFVFNTYFLLLIDGGQVGVALGYGISAYLLMFLIKTYRKFSLKNFLITTFSFLILTNVEIRFAAIVVFAFIVYVFSEFILDKKFYFKKIIFVLPLFFLGLIFNFYWTYPLLDQKGQLVSVFGDLNLISLKNVLFLYQPHWFLNEFGHTTLVPLYFIGLPFLIFLPLILKSDKTIYKLYIVFLFFAFFTKGGSDPFGQIYTWFVNNVPYLNIFRDSSKFFLILFLAGGILMGKTLEIVKAIWPKTFIYSTFVVFVYLVFLIWPAVSGKMTGVLGLKKYNFKEYEHINKLIGERYGRYLFFKTRPAFVSETYPGEIVNGDQLYKTRPFATLIEGVYDRYYFLWNPIFPKLLDLAGVDYMFFPPDLNKKTYSDVELSERDQFTASVSAEFKYEKVESLTFPGYKIDTVTPKIFSSKKALLVIGPDDIYEKLFTGNTSRMWQTPLIFLEDGDWSIESLINIDDEDLEIVFNQKGREDLLYRSLSGKILDVDDVLNKNWGIKRETIEWRDEARKSGVVTHDFDLGKGSLFSNISGETAVFKFNQETAGDISFALRMLGKNSKTSVLLDNQKISEIEIKNSVNFNYYPIEKIFVEEGSHELSIINEGGFVMLNFIKIYTQEEYDRENIFASNLLKKFKNVGLHLFADGNSGEVNYDQISETEYHLSDAQGPWIFLSTNYNSGWKLRESYHYPAYSFMNAYYINKTENPNIIYFEPQKKSLIGVKVGLCSGLVIITLGCVGLLYRRKIEKLLN